jgi:hypothetical protein
MRVEKLTPQLVTKLAAQKGKLQYGLSAGTGQSPCG